MSQIQATKLVPYVLVGPDDDEIAVSKVVMYLVLEPGDIDPGAAASRQGHIHAQVVRRR